MTVGAIFSSNFIKKGAEQELGTFLIPLSGILSLVGLHHAAHSTTVWHSWS